MMIRGTTLDRYEARVQRGDGCWEWNGAHIPNGYAVVWNGERSYLAHRFAYEHFVGPIAEGYQIDHLCRNRGCVRPDHLEAVTRLENVRRSAVGEVNGARQRAKTHCPRGHEYTPENTYVRANSRTGRPYRQCRACACAPLIN